VGNIRVDWTLTPEQQQARKGQIIHDLLSKTQLLNHCARFECLGCVEAVIIFVYQVSSMASNSVARNGEPLRNDAIRICADQRSVYLVAPFVNTDCATSRHRRADQWF
jgi:hypothetical protein